METETALALLPPKPHPTSYRVGVKTKSSKQMWVFNALRFGDKDSAEAYAQSLNIRWSDVLDYLIADSDDTPNCTFPVPSDRYPVPR